MFTIKTIGEGNTLRSARDLQGGCFARLGVHGGPVLFHQGDKAQVLTVESDPVDIDPADEFLVYGIGAARLSLWTS